MVDLSAIDGLAFCGVAETFTTEEALNYWPEKRVTWAIRDFLPRLSREDIKAAYLLGVESWERVCGIELDYSANHKTANIVITVADLGQKHGVLADSHLPPRGLKTNGQFTAIQRYDSNEDWTVADKPPAGTIDLVRVAAHEIGHAIGGPHGGNGLMKPSYDVRIRFPQSGYDTEFSQMGYGPRVAAPEPGDDDYVCRFRDGKLTVDGYRLTKIGG